MLPANSVSTASEWTSGEQLPVDKRDKAGDKVTLTIGAGGIAIVELVTSR
jgi:hypothetical protein